MFVAMVIGVVWRCDEDDEVEAMTIGMRPGVMMAVEVWCYDDDGSVAL